jgi:thiol-disulfide isomerase/thioredoxin
VKNLNRSTLLQKLLNSSTRIAKLGVATLIGTSSGLAYGLTAAPTQSDPTSDCVTPKKFTDKDYDELKAQNPEFLIYFWTPFMPLSVRGRKEIEALAKRNNIPKVVGVLDFSKRVCHKSSGIFADPSFDSKELAKNHALNHFPTILYVRNSQIAAQLPGYDLPEKFAERIKKIREKDVSK